MKPTWRRVRQGLGLFLIGVVVAGCAGIQLNADYTSTVRHDPLPLRAAINVMIAAEVRKDFEDKQDQIEEIRKTFYAALTRDLSENGPLTPVGEDPEARLDVVISKVHLEDRWWFPFIWMLAPLWLFGVPTWFGDVDLAVDIRLTAANGGMLFQTSEKAHCRQYQGIYYGHHPLAFGCPAKMIAESVREQMSLARSDILGRYESNRPKAAPGEQKGQGKIVVVFPIRDMSKQFDQKLLSQLTEYLAVQVVQQMALKVVPQEQLSAAMNQEKVASFKACYDESCQIELGKAVAANKSLATTLIQVGKRCVFNLSLFDLKTETTDKAASAETGCEDEQLLDGVRRAVGQLAATRR